MNNMPSIEPTPNGPYLVKGLQKVQNSKGAPLPTQETMAFCRCGGSNNKPYCDGTHATNGFKSEKLPGRVEDKVDDYTGKELTIHDNRGVCSHRGYCTDQVPAVFQMNKEPWINAEGNSPEKTISVIRKCPSGALSYTQDGKLYKNLDREPGVTVSKDGPYDVVGSVELNDPENKPESNEHYTLCRCGGSKNKPFCDGTHWHIKFKDEKN